MISTRSAELVIDTVVCLTLARLSGVAVSRHLWTCGSAVQNLITVGPCITEGGERGGGCVMQFSGYYDDPDVECEVHSEGTVEQLDSSEVQHDRLLDGRTARN